VGERPTASLGLWRYLELAIIRQCDPKALPAINHHGAREGLNKGAPMITEQQIRERAFHLWEADGRPHGRADHYWLSAERELQSITAPAPKKRTPAKKAEGSEAAPPRTTRQRKAPSEVRV